jgi:hypothetical protein
MIHVIKDCPGEDLTPMWKYLLARSSTTSICNVGRTYEHRKRV